MTTKMADHEEEPKPEETSDKAEEAATTPAPEASGGSPVQAPTDQAPADEGAVEGAGEDKPEEESKEEESKEEESKSDTPAPETEAAENVNNQATEGEEKTTEEDDKGQTPEQTTDGEAAPAGEGEEVPVEKEGAGEEPTTAEGEGDEPPAAEEDGAKDTPAPETEDAENVNNQATEEQVEVQEGVDGAPPGEEAEGEEAKPKEEGEEAGEEGEAKPQEHEEGEEEVKEDGEEAEGIKSPVPQSDTFTEGERAESPIGVGEKLSREGTPDSQSRLSDRQRTEPDTDILEPGTPERSRPGSAEEQEEREHGQLEPFEEEEEDEEEDEDEEAEFDREALIEKYHAAIADREQLQQSNYSLQHKLADYFRKKKADESRQDYDKNVNDQEQRYLKYMAQLEDLRRQDTLERESYKLQIEDLNIKCEEKKEWVDEERKKFMEFKKQVALNSLNSRSGKPIPPKDIEQYLQTENRKEADVVNVRLENIKLKNKLKKKEQQLKSKEELAEGLHLIDFEQLKIENQTYNEKIEERNEELLKLRKKITSTVQVLTHLKEKLQFVQAENHVHKGSLLDVEAHAGQRRDILSRTKQARDALRIDNTKLRQNCGLLGNEPLLRDFEDRKDEGDDLRERLDQLKMQHAELTLNCNQVRRKIEQVRAGPT